MSDKGEKEKKDEKGGGHKVKKNSAIAGGTASHATEGPSVLEKEQKRRRTIFSKVLQKQKTTRLKSTRADQEGEDEHSSPARMRGRPTKEMSQMRRNRENPTARAGLRIQPGEGTIKVYSPNSGHSMISPNASITKKAREV